MKLGHSLARNSQVQSTMMRNRTSFKYDGLDLDCNLGAEILNRTAPDPDLRFFTLLDLGLDSFLDQ